MAPEKNRRYGKNIEDATMGDPQPSSLPSLWQRREKVQRADGSGSHMTV